jgi:hypothetical protein
MWDGINLLCRSCVRCRAIARFVPIDYIPRGVRLTAYSGDPSDLPAHILQQYLDDVASGQAWFPSTTSTRSTKWSKRTPQWRPTKHTES